MKLVELLAKELSEWPSKAGFATQDKDGEVRFMGGCGTGHDFYLGILADYDDSTVKYGGMRYAGEVTESQWQAERVRQGTQEVHIHKAPAADGEWKRHRGGKQPVADGVTVDVKFNDGTQRDGKLAEHWEWRKEDADPRITQYRVISQPQAEEVEVKDTIIGTLSYKVEVDTSAATQAIDDLAAKWDQVDGPLRWRDCVNELDAYIEEFNREREALINRLAFEGFALIPAMTAVIGVSDDMNFWESWRVGDIIKVTNDHDIDDGQYAILEIEDAGYEGKLPVKTYKGWPDTEYATLEFVSRP